ncbi:MAG: hypothetical protein K6F63_07400 [Lachnospiraceae bacterium]|nr:hypothetical protein [Lachnospiraceae bacterium]
MYYIFVNPASKSGSGSALWAEAEKIFKERNIPYEVHLTKKNESIQKDYEEIYNKTTERPIKLIILGGDGTLNQVVQGITHLDETELSLIRNGSGNDFSRNKELPEDLPSIISGITDRKHELNIDVCESVYSGGCLPDGSSIPDGSHRYLVSSGLGYDADICYYANHSPKLKKLLKHQVYTFFGVKNVFTTGLADMEVDINGQISFYPHVYFLAAMNQPVEGGGVPMAPDASDTDGKLDFLVIYGLSRLGALLLVPKLKSKKHVGRKGVSLLRGEKIKVTCNIPKMVHYDGETPGLFKSFETGIIGQIRFIY